MAYIRNTNKKLTLRDIQGRNMDRNITPGAKEKTAVCGRCKHEFYISNMKLCPHPVVQKICGRYICYYDCRKCNHGQTSGSSVRCVYPDKRVKQVKNEISD